MNYSVIFLETIVLSHGHEPINQGDEPHDGSTAGYIPERRGCRITLI